MSCPVSWQRRGQCSARIWTVATFITSFGQIIVDMYFPLGSDRKQVFSRRGSHLGMKTVVTTFSFGKIKSATVKPMEQV
jgi:hypothetical protein